MRRYGNWGLMPFGALMGCVVPAAYTHGYREAFEVYENVSRRQGLPAGRQERFAIRVAYS